MEVIYIFVVAINLIAGAINIQNKEYGWATMSLGVFLMLITRFYN
jgi:hypothetical protein